MANVSDRTGPREPDWLFWAALCPSSFQKLSISYAKGSVCVCVCVYVWLYFLWEGVPEGVAFPAIDLLSAAAAGCVCGKRNYHVVVEGRAWHWICR